MRKIIIIINTNKYRVSEKVTPVVFPHYFAIND